MSLNLGSQAVANAHAEVLNGNPSTSWAVFTLPPNNELRVQETGTGEDFEEIAEEFSDGR
jgi:hypothetical protein